MDSIFVDTDKAGSLDDSAWSAGAGPVDSARATANAIDQGDWGDFATSAGVLALDGLAYVVDPVGTALAAGVGWLMEHLAPLRELLDFLAGDPNAIKLGADTWLEVKDELQKLADEFPSKSADQTSGWSGPAKDAYEKQVKAYTEGLQGLAISAGSASATIATSGTLVATCRAIVRDIVAAAVAEVVKGAVAALAGSVVSFGATVAGYLAYAAGRIGMTISKIVGKISQLLAKLGQAGAMLSRVLDDMAQIGTTIGADLTIAGSKSLPTAPAAAGAATAAGRGVSLGGEALGAVSTGTAGAARVPTAASGIADDLAAGTRHVSENAADAGTRWTQNADGLKQNTKQIVDGLERTGPNAEIAKDAADIRTGGGFSARSGLGYLQYHEQNYDLDKGEEANSGSYYDGYNHYGQPTGEKGKDGWYGFIPDVDNQQDP